MQLVMDMEQLPKHIRALEIRAQQEMSTPGMKTAGFETMKIFQTERLRYEMTYLIVKRHR